MTQDRMTMLFYEMFTGLPRQGPGDASSTLRALSLLPPLGPESRILDVGCGTGLQTRVLAQNSPARIVAIDNHQPYVAELNREASALGIGDRLEARVADMRQLDFEPRSIDVIWCEGAIYNVGFDAGLRDWRRLLAPGGHVALTEACWMKSDMPPECAAFWAQEYPAIGHPGALVAAASECGYDTIGHFPLPPSAWWDDYYRPLTQNVATFREDHRDEPDALALADQVQREIDIWHAYSEFYSYEFFVMRARL
jgi:ubiquinone/menaquinone biosynthesis C-methylase UbiE